MPEFEVSLASKIIALVGLCIVIPFVVYGYYLDHKDSKRRNKNSNE